MPLVSIIVPNYNHAPFLARRLDGILNQTFADREILLLDDASTDGSLDVIRRYQAHHPAIRVLINERNGGSPFKQWDRGVRAARGELVWIAESDDLAAPDLLEHLTSVMQAHPNAGIVHCASQFIDGQDRIFVPPGFGHAMWHGHSDQVNNGRHEINDRLSDRNTINNVSGALLRKSCYLDAGLADADMVYCGDWFLYIRMLLRADLGFVAKSMNFIRIHPGSTMHRYYKDPRYLDEVLRIFHFLKHAGVLSRPAMRRVSHAMARHLCLALKNGRMPSRQTRARMRDIDPSFMLRLPGAFAECVYNRLASCFCTKLFQKNG